MNFHIPSELVFLFTSYVSTRTIATILNFFFWYHNPDDWVSFVESSPRLALLVRISRAWGVDWRKLLRLIRETTRTYRKTGYPLPEASDLLEEKPAEKKDSEITKPEGMKFKK